MRRPSLLALVVTLGVGVLALSCSAQGERSIIGTDSTNVISSTQGSGSSPSPVDSSQQGTSPAPGSDQQSSPSPSPTQNNGSPSPSQTGEGSSSSSPSPSPSPTSGTGSSGGGDCIQNPAGDSCTGFTYPEQQAASHLDALCKATPQLVACSLRKRCNSGRSKSNIGKQPDTCDAVQLLLHACMRDNLKEESDCASVVSMCAPGNRVPACAKGLKHLPTTRGAQQLASSICEQMPTVPGCGRCPQNQEGLCSDVLSIYGQLCTYMDSFGECTLWHKSCDADSSLFICRPQPDAPTIKGQRDQGQAPTAATRRTGASPSPQWAPAASTTSAAASVAPQHLLLGSTLAAMVAAALLL